MFYYGLQRRYEASLGREFAGSRCSGQIDPSVQADLYNTGGFKYFANVLVVQEDPNHLVLPNASEHKAMCAFILSAIARDFPPGQMACWRERVFDNCFDRLGNVLHILKYSKSFTQICYWLPNLWRGIA